MKIIYFLDDKIKQLYPITLTRKASQITCGGYTLEKIVNEILKPSSFQYREANLPCAWRLRGKILWLSSRIVPWVVSLLKLKRALESKEKEGNLPLFNYPWEVILENNLILSDNLTYKMSGFRKHGQGVYAGEGVTLPKRVICDADAGLIILDNEVKVDPFVVLKGPLYVGPHTQIRDFTTLSHSSIGEICKIRGEIEESVIEGYTNKQHYGFVGHSYIGSWVNLGAGTTISDLKNTYGEIKVDFRSDRFSTGLQFLGAVIGDYAKTAINTSISSGKLIGPNSFLYGFITRNVPAFTNCFQEKMVEFYLEEAYKVQARMFSRRGVRVTEKERQILEEAFEKSKGEREKYGVKRGEFKIS